MSAPYQSTHPLVDVVVPTIGRWEFLNEAIDSIHAQVGVDTRVIVVNDSGETAPVGLAQRALVVNTKGREGEGAARAAGLAAVTGEWVAFCDDDDLWRPEKLARQLSALGDQPGWCLTAADRMDVAGKRLDGWGLGRLIEMQRADGLVRRLLTHNPVPAGASTALVHTELLRRVGGWDSKLRYFADWDCWIRLIAEAEPTMVDDNLVSYRFWPGQMINDRSGAWEALDYIRIKHADLRDRLGVGPLDDVVIAWILAAELRTPGRRVKGALAATQRLRPRHPRDLQAIGPVGREIYHKIRNSVIAD